MVSINQCQTMFSKPTRQARRQRSPEHISQARQVRLKKQHDSH